MTINATPLSPIEPLINSPVEGYLPTGFSTLGSEGVDGVGFEGSVVGSVESS